MALGIPSVVGPISEWMDSIVVEGCSPGATVIVQTDELSPGVVAKGMASGGRDWIPVIGTLKAKQHLVAFQFVPGDTSPLTPSALAVIVSASPISHAQLPPLAFVSKLYKCGRAVWLKGAASGAAVSLTSSGSPLGSGRADQAGNARFSITPFLPGPNSVVTAIQAAPPAFPPLTGAPQTISQNTLPSPVGKLPPPTVGQPAPMGCDSSIRINGVIDGAEVTIERASDGTRDIAIFDLDGLWFNLSKPFAAAGDRVLIRQALSSQCHEFPSDLREEKIGPARAPEPLDVDEPCAGSVLVHVRNLRPGAKLRVEVPGSRVLDYVVPPGTTIWDVPVEPLPTDKTIQITMEMCTFSTATTVAIKDHAPIPDPTMVPELYRCARAVSVKTTAGAWLEIWGDAGSGPMQMSTRVYAKHDIQAVGVSPFLTVPESVWARQMACGGAWGEGPSLGVQDHPRLKPVELHEPLVEGARAVLPVNAIPGAHVIVWATDTQSGVTEILGEKDVTRASPAVSLKRPLATHDVVWATQEICSEGTHEGPHYTVIPGVMRYFLPAVKRQLSRVSNGNAILHSGVFECRFYGGYWSLTVDFENTVVGYDCSAIIGVDLNLPSPLIFGAQVDVDRAANGGLPDGLAFKGYPVRYTTIKRGQSSLLENPAFWKEVLGATAAWKMIAAWRNYTAGLDKPDWTKGEGAPPNPNEIPNNPLKQFEDDD